MGMDLLERESTLDQARPPENTEMKATSDPQMQMLNMTSCNSGMDMLMA